MSDGYRTKKSFGQHFLADPSAAEAIANHATTPLGGTVLELGAGLGALTKYLLPRAARVIAVERDRDLLPRLRETFAAELAEGRLVLREADAAQVDLTAELRDGPRPHIVAGNLPYAITGKLMQLTVEHAAALDGAVFMVQKEVADRLAADADDDAYGALSVFTQAAFVVERVRVVKAGAFRPPPKVDSAVVVFTPHRPRRAEETPRFREAVRRAFAARRKTLRNAWKGIYGLTPPELEARATAAGIDLDRRGETLPVEAFAAIARE